MLGPRRADGGRTAGGRRAGEGCAGGRQQAAVGGGLLMPSSGVPFTNTLGNSTFINKPPLIKGGAHYPRPHSAAFPRFTIIMIKPLMRSSSWGGNPGT